MSRARIRVNVQCEDRTGTGLARLIEKAVNHQRAGMGKEPLWFPKNPGTIENNQKLLEQCKKYDLLRFRRTPCFDHVVYVIDALRAWDLAEINYPAPKPNEKLDAYLVSLTDEVREAMERRARKSRSHAEWAEIAPGFHPHVLVWERESLMLAVSEELGLGPAPVDVRAVRHPAKKLEERHKKHYNRKYAKSIDGRNYLAKITADNELRRRALNAVPSLAALIDDLVSL